jgi:polyisoprenoid-binding protein YceI
LRDDHLREEDFFNVEKYPNIVFTSSKTVLGEKGYNAIGTLELIGNKKPITISYSYNGKGKLEDGREFLAFRGEVTFDRYEYGMKPVAMTEAEVTLSFRLELVRKD